MGVEAEFTSSVPEELICSICHDVFENPVISCYNGHVFCKLCISEWCKNHKSCPQCKENTLKQHVNVPLLSGMTEKLEICCICDMKMPLSKKNIHETNECNKRDLMCPCHCGWSGSYDSFVKHICPESYTKCEKCFVILKNSMLVDHMEDAHNIKIKSKQEPTTSSSSVNKNQNQQQYYFQPGCNVDILDFNGNWIEGTIVMTRYDKYLVHYREWSNEWDEWVSSSRIRNQYTKVNNWRKNIKRGDRIEMKLLHGHHDNISCTTKKWIWYKALVKERINNILHLETLNTNNRSSVIKIHIDSNFISRIGVHT
jgi:hypothetical protein